MNIISKRKFIIFLFVFAFSISCSHPNAPQEGVDLYIESIRAVKKSNLNDNEFGRHLIVNGNIYEFHIIVKSIGCDISKSPLYISNTRHESEINLDRYSHTVLLKVIPIDENTYEGSFIDIFYKDVNNIKFFINPTATDIDGNKVRYIKEENLRNNTYDLKLMD